MNGDPTFESAIYRLVTGLYCFIASLVLGVVLWRLA